MTTEITFAREVTKLITALKSVTHDDKDLQSQIQKYEKGLNRVIGTDKENLLMRAFEKVWTEHSLDILTEQSLGNWLKDNSVDIPYGKGASGANLPLTSAYLASLNKMFDDNYTTEYHPSKYPKIILLHTYRILTVCHKVEGAESLKGRIALLEQELRQTEAQPQVGDFVQTGMTFAKSLFANNPEATRAIDGLGSFISSPDFNKNLSSLGSTVNDIISTPGLMENVTSAVKSVAGGKTSMNKAISDLLVRPEVAQQLDKLEGLKPLLSQATTLMETKDYPIPASLKGDLGNTKVSNILQEMLNDEEAGEQLNRVDIQKLMQNPNLLSSLSDMMQGRSAVNDIGKPSLNMEDMMRQINNMK